MDRVEAQHPTNPTERWTAFLKNPDDHMQWCVENRIALFMHSGAYDLLGGEHKGEKLAGQYSEQLANVLKIPKTDHIPPANNYSCDCIYKNIFFLNYLNKRT